MNKRLYKDIFIWIGYFLFFLVYIMFISSRVAADPLKDSLIKELKIVKKEKKRAELYIQLSERVSSQNFKEALDYAQQGAFIAQHLNDHVLLTSAYKNMASVFFYMGLYEQSLTYFERCAVEAGKAEKIFEQLNAQTNRASIYSAIGEYGKSIDIYKKGKLQLEQAYRIDGKEMPVVDKISFLLNIGYNHVELKQYDKAYPFIDSALNIVKAAGSADLQMVRAKLLQTKAKALVNDGDADQALILLNEAEKIIVLSGDKTTLLTIKGLRGKAFEQKGKIADALLLYQEGFKGANELGSMMLKRYFANDLSKLFQILQQSDSALRYVNLSKEYDIEAADSKLKEELANKEFLEKFAVREKQLLKEKESDKQQYVLIIGSILILTIFLVLLYKKKYQRAELKQFKWKLDAEQLELDREQLQSKVDHQEKQLEEFEYRLSKNALLQTLVGELQSLGSNNKIDQIDLKQTEQSGKIWDEFDIRFLQTHAGFFDRLMKACPGLTMNERRLCAFLLLDMSTKEISIVTGQSIRAIEIARTRLRKKLNLIQTEISLFEYLSSI